MYNFSWEENCYKICNFIFIEEMIWLLTCVDYFNKSLLSIIINAHPDWIPSADFQFENKAINFHNLTLMGLLSHKS